MEGIRAWLDTATAGIRFGPDRAEVRAELSGHLEDKLEGLRRSFPDMPPQELEERALGSMGDARAVGRALARLHRPWLGWLWRLSQGVLLLAAGLLVFTLFVAGVEHKSPECELWDFDGLPSQVSGQMERFLPADDPGQLLLLRPELEEQMQGQQVALKGCAVWQEGYREQLYLYLRLSSWRFWAQGVVIAEWLRITDSLGNTYGFGRNAPADGALHILRNQMISGGYGPFHRGMVLCLGDFAEEAEWIRLDYGAGETLFSFTLDLKEGAS